MTDTPPRFRFAVSGDDFQSASLTLNGDTFPVVPGEYFTYNGELKPFTRYTARLDAVGKAGSDSRELEFYTGRMGTPWNAEFITDGEYKFTAKRVSPKPMLFRKRFDLADKPLRAEIYATALGVYELDLNGKKVGDEYFAPGFTAYKTNLYYTKYDITDMLDKSNELLAEVAGGWAVGSYVFSRKNRVTADRQSLLLELRFFYADGREEVIGTDESWDVTMDGNRLEADLYDGEAYDARIELSAARWKKASLEKVKINPHITANIGLAVKRHERFTPISVNTVGGITVYDFGQNCAGIVKFKVNARAGTKITIRHAEVLNSDGTLNTAFLRSAKARIEYICKDGEQEYSPCFTYMGFRYIGVEGISPENIEVEMYALYSDLREIGTFECSDPMLNKLNQNIIWGAKSNLVDIPTDCPQRDERMGWTGDIAMFAPTACYNFDMSRFLDKWLCDMRAEQLKTGGFHNTVPVQGYGFPVTMPPIAVDFWGDACILVPYAEYMARGDIEILRAMYPAMKKYVKACKFWANIGIGKYRYIWHTPSLLHFGDWVSPDVPKMSQWQKRSKWTATASLKNCSTVLAEIAEILGQSEDAEYYRKLAKKVTDSYISVFTDGKGKLKKEFQTAYVLPLAFGMFDEKSKAAACDNLVRLVEENDYCIATGIPGTPYILFALSDNGRDDVAYKMLLNKKCPSWLYEVKVGATTVWERWDGLNEDGICEIANDGTGGMVSYNHYVFGSVGSFLYRRVLGIEPTGAGYSSFRVKPVLGGDLTYAKGGVETPYGKIETAWEKTEGKFELTVTVPYGTECTAVLPDGSSTLLRCGTHSLTCNL